MSIDYVTHVSNQLSAQQEAQSAAIAKAGGIYDRVGAHSGLSPAAMHKVATLNEQQAYQTSTGWGATVVVDEAYPPGHPLRRRIVTQSFDSDTGGTMIR